MVQSNPDLLKKIEKVEKLYTAYINAKKELSDYKSIQKKGNSIIKEQKKTPYIIYSESTPNPLVMKFVANKLLVKKEKECKSIKDTATNTLLHKVFGFPFVQEIYIARNYISIKKHDIVEWADVTNQIRIFIQEELNRKTKIYQINPTKKNPIKKM